MDLLKNIRLDRPDSLIPILWVALAFFLPFFKPAISIGMGALFVLSIYRFFIQKDLLDFSGKKQVILKVLLVYGLLLLWFLLSALWSTDGAEAWYRLKGFDELLLVPVLILGTRDFIYKYREYIFQAAVWGCTVAGVVALYFFAFPERIPIGEGYYYLLKELSAPRDYLRFGAYSPFLDRLYYGYLVGTVLLFFALKIFYGQAPRYYWWCLLVLIPLFAVIGARGAQLAFLLAGWVLFMVGTYRRLIGNRERVSRWAVGGFLTAQVVLLAGVFYLVATQSERFSQLEWEIEEYLEDPRDFQQMTHHSSVLRWVSWEHNLKLMGEHPILGVGVGDYVPAMEASYLGKGVKLQVHSNQQFFYFGVVGGLVALFLFCVFFFASGHLLFWRSGKR
nr:O-antigen ligase family protein [Saprospiraceae bacterium]